MMFSEETRVFYGRGFARPLVATLATGISEEQLVGRYEDGFIHYHHSFEGDRIHPSALLQLLSRVARTGLLLPSFAPMSHPECIAPISLCDQLKLAVRLCELPHFPTEMVYEKESLYLRARSIIEETIGVPHIHLQIPCGREDHDDRAASISAFAEQLALYELGFAASPELRNMSLSQLLGASKSVITALGGPANAVTAASSVISITDLYAHNFEAAFSVALAGTSIALIFRFSDYFGRIFKVAERELEKGANDQVSDKAQGKRRSKEK